MVLKRIMMFSEWRLPSNNRSFGLLENTHANLTFELRE